MNLQNKKVIMIIFLVVCILIAFLLKDNFMKILYPKTYQEIVSVYADKYGIEENLIFAVIKAESNFDKNVISNRNAVGLMQLVEQTAKEVAEKNKIEINLEHIREELCNVPKNIEIGTCYLAILIKKYQNKELALSAYNAGTGKVDSWIQKGIIKSDGTDIENIPYKETNQYIRKILRNYKIYQDLYKN